MFIRCSKKENSLKLDSSKENIQMSTKFKFDEDRYVENITVCRENLIYEIRLFVEEVVKHK